MRIAIYSVLFGDYDTFKEPTYVQPDCDYFLFTNQDIRNDGIYNVVYNFLWDNEILVARRAKIVAGYSFLCAEGYDLIIYTDCNIVQKADFKHLIDIQVNDLMILKHPNRKCIYDEYNACCDANRDNKEVMRKQVQGYADNGYPVNSGLVASGVIFRRNSKEVLKFCKAWLKEVENGSIRDQLSFNYTAWKRKYKFDLINWQFLYEYWDYNSSHKK